MLSNLSVNALSIPGTEAINQNDQSIGTLNDTAIAPHTGRKRASAPRMHCFEFRELLQAKRQKWLPQAQATIAASGEVPGISQQLRFAEGHSIGNEPAEMRTAIELAQGQELLEIDAALARISDGSYGTCIDCGGEIGRARLKTQPTAMRCPPCVIGTSRI